MRVRLKPPSDKASTWTMVTAIAQVGRLIVQIIAQFAG